MEQKLITFAVPCYNSAAYSKGCFCSSSLKAWAKARLVRLASGIQNPSRPHFLT